MLVIVTVGRVYLLEDTAQVRSMVLQAQSEMYKEQDSYPALDALEEFCKQHTSVKWPFFKEEVTVATISFEF